MQSNAFFLDYREVALHKFYYLNISDEVLQQFQLTFDFYVKLLLSNTDRGWIQLVALARKALNYASCKTTKLRGSHLSLH
jgi:hypothetical protein